MNNYTKLVLIGAMEGKNIQNTPLVLTATTTAAQTLTLYKLTIATGKTVVVDWGDGNTNSYTGTGTRTHDYAGAGTWTVKFTNRIDITELGLYDTKLSWTINGANPLPANLIYLYLYNLSGLTYNANTNPLPINLTYLYLINLSGLTWEINAAQPMPAGVIAPEITGCPNVTCTAWTRNNTQSIKAENAYNEANVDAWVNSVWANKANFTYATPSLDLLGGSNAAPSGTYQAANPPTTGKEKLYDLVNGNYTPAGPEWSVQFQGQV